MESTAMQTLTSPVVLFFVLGFLAAVVRSDLSIPEQFAKAMSIYLMIAIGLKGGVEIAQTGLDAQVLSAAAAGIGLSFLIPFAVFAVLRAVSTDAINAGAIAAHYGSVSVVTFVTAVELYRSSGLDSDGFMVGVMALMETPAIITGLLLARRFGGSDTANTAATSRPGGGLAHEVLTNASVILLLGAFAVGWIIGPAAYEPVSPLFTGLFKGVLCVFLLDMGLVAARRLFETRALTAKLVAVAIGFPIVNGAIGVAIGTLVGLNVANSAVLGVLAASASYIAVPAAMRLSLPEANPGVSLAMSLGVTFPFNIVVGIPLFAAMANMLG
ncbi:hypothetical protein HME9302_01181 [Alteripontixanthobacter maritimus]|uniref:Sodium-dependent bicarbonate transport family permease n=1 Tax=Alteripontixanthobacter maritimus TaxID=2161824 RepID=A0A369Q505_9SPHN|nr:sodium-dependent bicarbonate transport family permease [Alteripontixanthobacter maritimus]RDC59983.1 hypothetical protein HME9302_01181 [Alteripontixanthobacter maritimus]